MTQSRVLGRFYDPGMPPPTLRRLNQQIQNASFWISVALSLGVGAFVGAQLEVVAQASFIWQQLLALAVAILVFVVIRAVGKRWAEYQTQRLGDDELADAIDDLAQRMVQVLADGLRTAPDPPVTANWTGGSDEQFQAWQQAVAQRTRHDNAVLARLMEMAQVGLGGLLAELRRREVITNDEVRSFLWRFQSIHTVGDAPAQLGEWANELRQ